MDILLLCWITDLSFLWPVTKQQSKIIHFINTALLINVPGEA